MPDSGRDKDRTLIAEYTAEDADDLWGFQVNSLDCMVQDPSVNNSWKNLAGGLYDTFNNRKPSRQSVGGFMNDIQSSSENLSQENIQSTIDIQPKVMEAIIASDGGHTSDLQKAEINFYEISIKSWYENHLYYWEIDDNVCLCKLSEGQKSGFSF